MRGPRKGGVDGVITERYVYRGWEVVVTVEEDGETRVTIRRVDEDKEGEG